MHQLKIIIKFDASSIKQDNHTNESASKENHIGKEESINNSSNNNGKFNNLDNLGKRRK